MPYTEPSDYTKESYGHCYEAYIEAESGFHKLVDGEQVQLTWHLFTTNNAFANKTEVEALKELEASIELGYDIHDYTMDKRDEWKELK